MPGRMQVPESTDACAICGASIQLNGCTASIGSLKPAYCTFCAGSCRTRNISLSL